MTEEQKDQILNFKKSGQAIHDFCVENLLNESKFIRLLAEANND